MKLEVMDQAFDGDILPETAYIAIVNKVILAKKKQRNQLACSCQPQNIRLMLRRPRAPGEDLYILANDAELVDPDRCERTSMRWARARAGVNACAF